ncbi:MerR family transcriptional regulator [Nonomuraea sp. NPDC046570]|uniref:MerR family transcriptional regulator n=1 Tax=Nonomuraea sp. NPDC046570 TaxID=3155255 RepID=UPI0033E07475
MRISQLSARSGVAIPTIKYYLRESLLHQGVQLAATRAEYDESHLRRLRLIRALLEVGKLPVAAIKKVIEAVEDESLPVHDMLGTAHYALSTPVETGQGADWELARDQVEALLAAMDWHVDERAPSRAELAQTLVKLRELGLSTDVTAYARAADTLVVEQEMDTIPFDGPREAAVEAMVLGTVLYGKAFDALRRLAQESESARRLANRAT